MGELKRVRDFIPKYHPENVAAKAAAAEGEAETDKPALAAGV